VPARVASCHCGTTRERALEASGRTPGPGARPDGRRESIPNDVRLLLAAAALVLAGGIGWASFAPTPRNSTPPLLGWVEPGPPDVRTLRRDLVPPPPKPPFRMPWWK
jgi:hypothetical protein